MRGQSQHLSEVAAATISQNHKIRSDFFAIRQLNTRIRSRTSRMDSLNSGRFNIV